MRLSGWLRVGCSQTGPDPRIAWAPQPRAARSQGTDWVYSRLVGTDAGYPVVPVATADVAGEPLRARS